MCQDDSRLDHIEEYVRLCRAWKVRMQVWSAIHYVGGIVAILLATTVAAKPFGDAINYSLVAWASAIATACVAFLQPEQRHNRFAHAWSILTAEIVRFRSQTNYSVDAVIGAADRGESAIHHEDKSSSHALANIRAKST